MDLIDRLSPRDRQLYLAAQERELQKVENADARASHTMSLRDETGQIIFVHVTDYLFTL